MGWKELERTWRVVLRLAQGRQEPRLQQVTPCLVCIGIPLPCDARGVRGTSLLTVGALRETPALSRSSGQEEVKCRGRESQSSSKAIRTGMVLGGELVPTPFCHPYPRSVTPSSFGISPLLSPLSLVAPTPRTPACAGDCLLLIQRAHLLAGATLPDSARLSVWGH